MLQNKLKFWTSDEEWNFKTKDDSVIYVENISKTKVLGTSSDGEVILEDFEESKVQQLWKKGKINAEGFFTLQNSTIPMLMTAISSSVLQLKGNIILR